MSGSWRDRIVVDGADRAEWETARGSYVGASDAAHFAKASSIDKYVAAKLRAQSFHGNAATAEGNRWEPMMLAYAGIPQNLALIAHRTIPGLAATPDGILTHSDGSVELAECKTRIRRITDGPSLQEWRQLALQFEVMPEATQLHFLWCELVGPDDDLRMRTDVPHELIIPRGSPRIVAARQQMLPIATEVAARLRAALEFKEALAS